MQTDSLRYFIDVATLGSMNAAAKKNFMTPQGISRSIVTLESELGCELFLRDSNKVTLTHFGERILDEARGIIECENRLRQSAIELQANKIRKRSLRFICYASSVFFDTPLFYPVSGMGTALYEKVQFLQRETPQVVEQLMKSARYPQPDVITVGGLGLCELFANENAQMIRKLTDAGYEYRPFMLTHDHVLVPSFFTLARAKALSNDDIRSYPLAVAASGGMERAIEKHIGADSIYVASGDSSHRARLCRMGEALTFVPGVSLVFGVPEGTVAVPMQNPYAIEIGFIARKTAFQAGMLAETLERLTTFYAARQGEGEFSLLDPSPNCSMFWPKGFSTG